PPLSLHDALPIFLVPHDVGSPGTWHRSLYARGTPWSGPRQRPAAASASSVRAAASAPSASTVMKLRMAPSSRAMRSRYARVASTGEICFARIAPASATSVRSVTAAFVSGAVVQRGGEVGRLFAERQHGAHPLDE